MPFPGAGKVWDFIPTSRSYSPLSTDQSNQDFTAILIGDVSGNWGSGVGGIGGNSIQGNASANLTLQGVKTLSGKQITVGLMLDLEQAALYGADIILSYNTSALAVVSVSGGELANNFAQPVVNLSQPGKIIIAMAGATPHCF